MKILILITEGLICINEMVLVVRVRWDGGGMEMVGNQAEWEG